MNRKQLITLLVIGLIVGAAGFWKYKSQQAGYKESTQRMGEKLMPGFPLNDVAQLTIKQKDAEMTLAKKNDAWAVKERSDYPANFSNIRDLLIKIADLKIAKPVKVPASRLPNLELLPPDKCASTLVEFKDDKGKTIKSLLLGAKHNKEGQEDSPYGGGGYPDGRYVMVNNDLQTAALISDALSSAEPKPQDWLNKDWFKVEKLRSVSVTSTNATNDWKLFRDSETNDWKLADAKAGEQLDSSKISSITSLLSSPFFNDLAVTQELVPLAVKAVIFRGIVSTSRFTRVGIVDLRYGLAPVVHIAPCHPFPVPVLIPDFEGIRSAVVKLRFSTIAV